MSQDFDALFQQLAENPEVRRLSLFALRGDTPTPSPLLRRVEQRHETLDVVYIVEYLNLSYGLNGLRLAVVRGLQMQLMLDAMAIEPVLSPEQFAQITKLASKWEELLRDVESNQTVDVSYPYSLWVRENVENPASSTHPAHVLSRYTGSIYTIRGAAEIEAFLHTPYRSIAVTAIRDFIQQQQRNLAPFTIKVREPMRVTWETHKAWISQWLRLVERMFPMRDQRTAEMPIDIEERLTKVYSQQADGIRLVDWEGEDGEIVSFSVLIPNAALHRFFQEYRDEAEDEGLFSRLPLDALRDYRGTLTSELLKQYRFALSRIASNWLNEQDAEDQLPIRLETAYGIRTGDLLTFRRLEERPDGVVLHYEYTLEEEDEEEERTEYPDPYWLDDEDERRPGLPF